MEKKEKRSAAEKPKKQKKTFIYEQTAISKIFPIDCSEIEIQKNTGIKRSKFRRWIMDESPMKRQLKNLIMSNEGETYKPLKGEKQKYPYPIEAMPFLSAT